MTALAMRELCEPMREPRGLTPILNIVRFRELMVEGGGIRCSEGVGDFLTTTSSSSKEVEDLLSTGPPPVM